MIINIVDLIIDTISINYVSEFAEVGYHIIDDQGKTWKSGLAIFWVTMPPPPVDENGDPLPYPDEWFELPAGYLPTLLNLKDDADTALTNTFLV